MVTLTQQFQPHPDVVDTELEGQETVLLHLESQTYYSLNLTGMWIWRGLKEGRTLQEISRRLQEVFDVEEAQAERSVLTLIEELCQQKLIQSLV